MVSNNYRELGTRLLIPLAKRLQINPTILSLISLLSACGAGFFFYKAEPGIADSSLLIAGILVFVAAVFDALDGIVARMTGTASKRGDLIDHTLDRVADILILGGISLGPIVEERVGVVALLGVLLLSYMGTQAQAVGAGRVYEGVLGRADRLVILTLVPMIQYFVYEPFYDLYIMEWMAYGFGIICTASAGYRFSIIWKELENQ